MCEIFSYLTDFSMSNLSMMFSIEGCIISLKRMQTIKTQEIKEVKQSKMTLFQKISCR